MRALRVVFVLFLSYDVFSAPIQNSNGEFCGINADSMNEYYVGKRKWLKTDLTWSVRSFPAKEQFSELRTREILREAFQTWTNYIPIEIQEVCSTCKADLVIEFVQGDHGNCEPFDGPGRVLAHASFPEKGLIHFDLDELWGNTSHGSDTDLFLVALHEIGHALGLGHSDNSVSIMASRYPPESHSKDLPSVDIDSIQHLYGSRKEKTAIYQLIHVGSNKSLDVFDGNKNDYTNVQIYRNHGSPNQLWTIYRNNDGTVKLINPHTSKALDVRRNEGLIGTNVQIHTENGSPSQRWILRHIGRGIYKIIHKHSGKVLDVYDNRSADETNVQIWDDNGSAAQQWLLVSVDL